VSGRVIFDRFRGDLSAGRCSLCPKAPGAGVGQGALCLALYISPRQVDRATIPPRASWRSALGPERRDDQANGQATRQRLERLTWQRRERQSLETRRPRSRRK